MSGSRSFFDLRVAASQSPCLHENLAVLSACGACLAPTEVKRRCCDSSGNTQSMFPDLSEKVCSDDKEEKHGAVISGKGTERKFL